MTEVHTDSDHQAMPVSRHVRRRGPLSSLTRRVLAVNVLALLILVAGLLYLDQYRNGLIEARLQSLRTQGELIAGALGASAIKGAPEAPELDAGLSRQILRRLVETTGVRARLFVENGTLIADSRRLLGAGRRVVGRVLPSPGSESGYFGWLGQIYDWFARWIPEGETYPRYLERPDQRAEDYTEAMGALRGDMGWGLRDAGSEGQIISVAVPVQAFKKVQGALLLSTDDRDVEKAVRVARIGILQVFVVALGITVLLSLFLAGTIARPVRRLAEAADQVRRIAGHRVDIPDFTARRDEIGDLSGALRDMTYALYARLDAIESFAADVAHEIKNPLTSLRSAVETLDRVSDPGQRAKLLRIIVDDVGRLDRLISDISDASRLDAEMSRVEFLPLDVGTVLQALADVFKATKKQGDVEMVLDVDKFGDLKVMAAENRLARVVRNLLDNAATFSPPGGRIGLSAWREDSTVRIMVEDEGPGLPEDKLDSVFERFYTARPADEAFGTHSGLGLSISKQIVEAHGGTITARNRRDPMGKVIGACFMVRLPAASFSRKGGRGTH